jgi:hypothetical protein
MGWGVWGGVSRLGVWQGPSTIVLVLVLDYERGLGLASTELPRASIEGSLSVLGETAFEDEDDDEYEYD